jgi:hypothetical protein
MRVSDLLSGFCDELEKIAATKTALIGAMIGGAAGYAVPGKSMATKAINTAVGAGVGHVTGKVLGGAKRGVWDQPRARAEQDLHGYQPSTVTNPEMYGQ